MNEPLGLLNGFKFDKYTVQARMRPSLLVLLPVLVIIALWLPAVWTILGGLSALVSACGLIFLLSELARYRGRKIERKMIADNGGKFTTILLRHRDSTISTATKKTYHEFLSKNSNRPMPSAEVEQADPPAADDCYRGATEWLLEQTRCEKTFPLVKAENISYGFRRNLLGLKSPALGLITTCLLADAFFTLRSFRVDETRFQLGCILAFALAAAAAIWIGTIRMDFIEDAGRTYALRLLAQCDVLTKKPKGKAPTRESGKRSVKTERSGG
jgi:hypothetical protein